MSTLRTATAVALLFVLAACAAGPPTMTDPSNGGIGIAVETISPDGMMMSGKPVKIHFVRSAGKPGTYEDDVMPSNYSKSGRFYLLDIPAGRYAAVAAFTREHGAKDLSKSDSPPATSGTYEEGPGPSDKTASLKEILKNKGKKGYTTCFSRELVRLSETIVGPGRISYMGRFKVRQVSGGGGRGKGKVYKGDCDYFGRRAAHERDSAAFLSAAKEDFANSKWGGAVGTQ